MRNSWPTISFSALLALAGLSSAQTVDKPASVRGAVIDTVTGAPIPRVHVTLRGNANGTQLFYGAMTTADGSFSIDSITPAQYSVFAERVGYVGPSGPVNAAFTLQADDKKTGVTLKLTPTGAITGRVTDADGQPVERANVMAEGTVTRLGTSTDDTGQYRIGGLAPGRYRVTAGPGNRFGSLGPEIRTDGTEEVYDATTYFPGRLDMKSASRVRVGPGADVSGVDIRLARAPLIHISGRVIGIPAGSENAMVQASSRAGMNSTAQVRKDGTFELWRLNPGKYVIAAIANGRGLMGLRSAGVEIDVAGSSVEGVELRMFPSSDLAGRLEYDDDQAKQMPKPLTRPDGSQGPPVPQRRVMLTEFSSTRSTVPTVVDPDDSFRFKSVPPSRYRVTVIPGNVYVKSVSFGSTTIDGAVVDLSNGAAGGDLSVLLSSATGSISGTIKDDNPGGTRIVLAVADDDWQNRYATAAADGTWSIDNLAPGSYKIVAVQEADTNSVMQRGGLDDYEDAMEPVGIHPGDKLTKDLKRANPR